MFAIDIFPLLIFFGLIMSFLIALKQRLGPYSWILSVFFIGVAIAIFAFALFKRAKFSKMFPHKFALTIALTVVSVLLLFALVMLPVRAKAETVSNTCTKNSDCVLLSVCNVILASSKAVAKANDQYELKGRIYYSKIFKDCDPNYANIKAPDHRTLVSKCVQNTCVLRKEVTL